MTAVQEISLREYEALGGIHALDGTFTTSEQAWFRCNDVLGIVLLDRIDHDWSWVCLAKHPDRGMAYRAIDLRTSVSSFELAREYLMQAMAREATAWNRFRDTHTPDPK